MCTHEQQLRYQPAHPTASFRFNKLKIKRGVSFAFTLAALSSPAYSAWHACSQNLFVENDIINFNAILQSGYLNAYVYARKPFSSLAFATHRKIEFFINADQNVNTGDARPGAIRGADFRISCFADFPSCTMYRLPTTPYGQETTTTTPVQAVLYSGSRALGIRVPFNYTASDIFATTHGGNAFNGGGTGNGDRCPETGVFDTATGSAKVRLPALPVDATASDLTGSQLNSWRFQTIGDQFRIQVAYRNAIRVTDMGFQGRLELDTDRTLTTGLVQTPFLINSPFNEIPTWGWDVAIQFQGGSSSSSDPTPFYLDFGKQSAFIQPPRGYAYPYGFSFGETYNDGRWRLLGGNQLILEGSLSMLDARHWRLPLNGTASAVRLPTKGQIIGRLFTNLSTQITDMIPKNKRAFDTATKLSVPSIAWIPAQTISKTDPVGDSGVKQWDLIKIDTEIANKNLVVRGTLARLEPSWAQWAGIIWLDTDNNSSTGTPVNNPPGGTTIGADYQLVIYTLDLGGYFGRTTYLMKPDKSKEGHDSWVNFKYSNPSQVNSPASFIATIPLASIGNPKGKIRFYIGTFGNQLSDIGPPQPLVIDLAQYQTMSLQDEDAK